MKLNVDYLEEDLRNKLKEKLELDDLNVIEKEGNLIIGENFKKSSTCRKHLFQILDFQYL